LELRDKEFTLGPDNFSHDYIVRIYRFEKNKPRNLVGLVEEVGKKGKQGFHTYDELWEILNFPKENKKSKSKK
jgi:hypothetical protein